MIKLTDKFNNSDRKTAGQGQDVAKYLDDAVRRMEDKYRKRAEREQTTATEQEEPIVAMDEITRDFNEMARGG